MLKRTIAFACLLANAPAWASGAVPPSSEACDTPAAFEAFSRKFAVNPYVILTFLDGDQAHRFLAAIVPAGDESLMTATDHIAVVQRRRAPQEAPITSSFVILGNNVCGGNGYGFTAGADATIAALAAAKR